MTDKLPCTGRISLASEKIVDIFNLKSEDLNVWDIAWALSQINRYNGCTPIPFDVLSHTGLVYALYMAEHTTPESRNPSTILALLLHDAAEAFIGDIPVSLKTLDQMAWLCELEDELLQVIFNRFGLDWQSIDWETISRYDNMAGNVEVHWLKPKTKSDEYFTKVQVEMPFAYKPLSKARPIEWVKLVYAGAQHFHVVDMDALFATPPLLEPYIDTAELPSVSSTQTVVEGDASFPALRDSSDVDNMRV